jgi:SAM-dependent methyltransferase
VRQERRRPVTSFGTAYSSAYDALYRDKDYDAECALLSQIFEAEGARSVLDLGCGTGAHSLRLAVAGYAMTGVDASEGMLAHARAKSVSSAVRVDWRRGDIRDLRLGKTFDAVIAMFAVLGYVTEDDGIRGALRGVRSHLRDRGLFVFDFWFGPAVLRIRPASRSKELLVDGRRAVRKASAELDVAKRTCCVSYAVDFLESASRDASFAESHLMRYFFPDEIDALLDDAGFRLRSLTEFPSLDRPADESTWNVLAIAEAVGSDRG